MTHPILVLSTPTGNSQLSSDNIVSSTIPDSTKVGVGFSRRDGDTRRLGSTRLKNVEMPIPQSRIYWNHLDTEWAENTQTTVAVFTTPSASVGGRSLNPLSEVDEDQFVTDEGAQYLEESGIRETAGLGPNLSWVVPPAEVASRSMTFLGNEVTMRSYVGYVKTGDSEIPRTLLINLAITETGDDIAFGVTVQHRDMYGLSGDNASAPTESILSAMSVPDLVGAEANTGLNVSAGDDITLIVDAGLAASTDLASTALGDISLA